jgi:hypothetical protein
MRPARILCGVWMKLLTVVNSCKMNAAPHNRAIGPKYQLFVVISSFCRLERDFAAATYIYTASLPYKYVFNLSSFISEK